MANPEYVAKLKEDVQAWNAWRAENRKITPDLRHADLKAANLKNANLKGAKLKEANLEGADVSWADLEGADLSLADLEGAHLEGANLLGAKLTPASLKGAKLNEANLEGADLRIASLEGADLWGANLKGANLEAASLEGANLGDADLEGARLGGANLKRANLTAANLKSASLERADLEGADLWYTTLRGADLWRANLEGAQVTGIKFNRWAHYRGIRVSTCYGSARFKRFAQDQDFLEEFRSSRWRRPVYWLWLIFADCGRSLWPWLCWSIAIAVGFGVKFYSMGEGAFEVRNLGYSLKSMVYYSVVTFTTLGFGDIVPKTHEAASWVMAEVITGYVMLGGLISIFATKLARRS